MIHKIDLYNYRQFGTKTVEFNPRLHVIQGRNGTGKSTIVEAIAYALQGSSVQKGKSNAWIRNDETNGGVDLYLDEYIISRHTNKQTVSDLEGNIIARGHTGINEWVEQRYGLVPELFKTSFYIGQKDVDSFAGLSPMERTKRVEKLLRIDILDTLKKTVSESIKFNKAEVSSLKNKLDEAIYSEDTIIKLTEELDDLKIVHDTLSQDLTVLVGQDAIYQTQLAQWNKKQVLLSLIPEHSTLEDTETKILEEEAKLRVSIQAEANNKLFDEKEILLKKTAGINVLEEYFKYSIQDLMNHKSILKHNNLLQSDLDLVANVIAMNHGDKLVKAKESLTAMTREHKQLVNSPDTCSSCGQDMPDIKKTRTRIAILAKDIEELQAKVTEQIAQQDKFNLSARVQELPLGKDLDVEEAIKVVTLKPYLDRLADIASVEYIEAVDIHSLETELSNLRERVSRFKKLEEYSEVTEEPIKVDLQSFKARLVEVNDSILIKGKALEAQLRAQAIHDQYYKDFLDKETLIIEQSRLVKFIDAYRKEFSDNIVPLLTDNVSKIMSYLTEGKFTHVQINKDYSIENYDLYSGSEEDSVNFALRLAVAQISRLGDFNTMMLDEIAASFDSVKESLLLDILKSTDMQLIYISHGDLDF
jgi:DNA repair exonuclease SbcCD ATPase subunit